MKPGNNNKALVLSILMLLGFAIKTVKAQTDSTMPRTETGAMQYIIVDLYTLQPIDIYYDPARYMTINRANNQPVEFYVVNNVDTVMGATGLIVNGMLLKEKDGKYKLDNGKVKWDGKELKMKENAGRKVKWEKGKMEIKDWQGKSTMKSVRAQDAWSVVPWRDW